MSHLRPEDRSAKSNRAACRKGRHLYGESQSIGGGIQRRVCDTCGEITIDLTGVQEVTTPVSREGRIATLTPDS
ncbi:MAG TPA: hypothetical protein VFS66_10065 [Acidimicrobiia bacterium]|nr:hypothetical protein [Acidimicrobiia bacterium]